MSHFSCVRTKMTDLELIDKACKSLGLTTVRNSYVRGWSRQCTPAPLVVKLDSNYDIGFKDSGDGSYHVVADFAYAHPGENHGHNLQTLWQSILAKYSIEKAIQDKASLGSSAKVNVSI